MKTTTNTIYELNLYQSKKTELPGKGSYQMILNYKDHWFPIFSEAKGAETDSNLLAALIEAVKAVKIPSVVNVFVQNAYLVRSLGPDSPVRTAVKNDWMIRGKKLQYADMWQELIKTCRDKKIRLVLAQSEDSETSEESEDSEETPDND